MWALPHNAECAKSCWSVPGEEVTSRIATLREIDASPLVNAESDLVDPPWLEDAPDSDDDNKDKVVRRTRKAPPISAVDQQCTTVQFVKKNGDYTVLLDGVETSASVAKNDGVNDVPSFWLPRFREVQTDKTDAVPSRRTAGPLCVGVRLEEAEIAPVRVVVSMRQSILEGKGLIMNPYDADVSKTQVLREEIISHSVDDHMAGYALLPYPACITRQPIITIVDMDERRRWEFARRKWNAGRTQAVVSNISGLIMYTTGARLASNTTTFFTELAKRWDSVSPAKAMWSALLMQVSTPINLAVNAVTATLDLTWWGYETTKGPPNEVRAYDFSISEFTAALEYIKSTRSNGVSTERPRGMAPNEMSRSGRKREAALLYWLVYGNQSYQAGSNFDDVFAEKNDEEVLADATDGGATRTYKFLPGWPQWARWNTKELSGNLLDPRGLDPYIAMQSRVEYVIRVQIEEIDGKVHEFELRPLLANAIDAGYILTNVEGEFEKLKNMVQSVKEQLLELRKYGYSWLHQTLYVSDSEERGVFGSMKEWLSWLTPNQSLADDQRRRRWSDLQKELKSDGKPGTMPPLVINPDAFVRRLKLLLYGPTGFKRLVDGNLPDEDSKARIIRRREEVAPRLFGRKKTGRVKGSRRGLKGETFNEWMAKLEGLYRQSLGIPQNTAEGPNRNTYSFWRWVDAYIPLLGFPDVYRLWGFIVPKIDNVPRQAPSLVRRLPQIGTVTSKLVSNFGATSILPVKLVPSSPLSDRKMAKAAVTAAKRCWARTIQSYRLLRWTVETLNFWKSPNSFHFLQLYNRPSDAAAFDTLVRLYPAQTSANVAALVASQPEAVSAAEAIANQFARADDARASRIAASEQRVGDGADLRTFKLADRRESVLALYAYASIVVYTATQHSATLRRGDLVQSSVDAANAAALVVADVIELLYGAGTKHTGLVSHDDIFFACLPYGGYARAALAQLDCWNMAQKAMRQSKALSVENFHKEWPRRLRARASAFAQALRAIARSNISPLKIPMIALHSMWYTGNPTVDRLLAVDPVAKSGMELQIREAVASFHRVRRLLANIPKAQRRVSAVAALHATVANRPVAFVAWIESRRERVARALQLSASATRRLTPAVPTGNRLALQTRCASLRLDATFALRNEDALQETAASLLNRMTALKINDVARYKVPPGSRPYAALPLDLSNTPALEDSVVWLESACDALDSIDVVSSESSAFADALVVESAKATTSNGRARHPHLIELSTSVAHVYLAVMPALDAEMQTQLNGAERLPNGIVDALHDMERRQAQGGRSLTWELTQRMRVLMWNVDRIMQLLLLIEATFPDPTRAILLKVPDAANNDTSIAIGIATAVAHAALQSVYPTKGRVALRASNHDAIRNALVDVRAVVPHEPRPMPLSELCLVLAAVAP